MKKKSKSLTQTDYKRLKSKEGKYLFLYDVARNKNAIGIITDRVIPKLKLPRIKRAKSLAMTNLEKWHFYMKDITSPSAFIEWGFYSLIGSALQRRVWTGAPTVFVPTGKPLFPNTYIILTAEPGIGKGLVITEVKKLLNYHKIDPKNKNHVSITAEDDQNKISKAAKLEVPTLIPIGADAMTYEALVKAMSKCTRAHWVELTKDKPKVPYFHSSICFALEEISSLFRKHTEDLVNCLLQTYDCGDYKYETVSRGVDFIKNCCLNLLGGTTPGFIRRIFGDSLINEGFASRSIFVFAEKNRFSRLRPPEYNEDQRQAHKELADHIRRLTELFGEVRFTSDAIEYLEDWWRGINEHPERRPNTNPKLVPYYARKNITAQKLAMILHFSESLTMEVNLLEAKKAVALLDENERHMHNAISTEGKNPNSDVAAKILRHLLRFGPQSKKALYVEFYNDLPNGDASLADALDYLLKSEKIVVETKGEITKFKAL